MPVELFPEDLLASTYSRIKDADLIKVDVNLFAETWTTIDEATPYSSEKFAFSYTQIDDVIPTNVDLFADTYTRIEDIVHGTYLDTFFNMSVGWYEDVGFYMDTERYLDTSFSFLTADIGYEDVGFYMDTERYLDVSFDFSVYDFIDIGFYMDTERYLDIEFYMGVGGALEINFLTYFPDHIDVDFIAGLAHYSDVDVHIPMTWYFIENNFRMEHIQMYQGFLDHLFIIKVTRYVQFRVELISLKRQLPATITIRGKIE